MYTLFPGVLSFLPSSRSSPRRLCCCALSGFLSMRWKRKGLSTRWKLLSPLCRRCQCKWSLCTPTHAPLCALSSSAAAAAIYMCTRYGLSTQEMVCDCASDSVLKRGIHSLTKQMIYQPMICASIAENIRANCPGNRTGWPIWEKKLLPLTSVILAAYAKVRGNFRLSSLLFFLINPKFCGMNSLNLLLFWKHSEMFYIHESRQKRI